MDDLSTLDIKTIMDSLSDGVYVCDLERRITFWSKSAERITGWSAEEVVGRQCFSNVLCHIDKDGHKLCGEEYCPLHRSMITDTGSKGSLLVYAQGKDGRRIPMQVSVAPIRNEAGRVIGGVETFRDASAMVLDLERAKVVKTDESFATAVCGLVDLARREFRFVGAGGPQALLMHRDGSYECRQSEGLPLAVMEDASYDEICIEFQEGDSLLLFSDGAVEIHNADDRMLGVEGLVGMLRQQGFPDQAIAMAALEEELLKYSNGIRLEDDLTLIEIRFVG